MSFTVHARSELGAVRVVVTGEVDPATAGELLHRLDEATARSTRVIADLAGVTFMDSSGLSALLTAHRTADAVDIPFHLERVPSCVERVLVITGLDTVLTIASRSPADLSTTVATEGSGG